MHNADKYGTVMSDKDVADGKRINDKVEQVKQVGEHATMKASEAIATHGEAALDTVLKAGKNLIDGGNAFKSVAESFGVSTKTFDTAVDAFMLTSAPEIWAAKHGIEAGGNFLSSAQSGKFGGFLQGFFGGGGNAPIKTTEQSMQKAGQARDFFMSREGGSWSRNAAAGFAANLLAESGMNPTAVGDNGAAQGEGQWHADRQANFRRLFHKDILHATEREQWAFMSWEAKNSHKQAGTDMQNAGSAFQAGAIGSAGIEAPADKFGAMQTRGALATQIDKIPVHVTIEHVNAPSGTKHKVESRGAVSTAMAN